MSYFPLGGGGGGAWTAIETVTISNQAEVDMDLSGSHKMYMFHIDNLVTANDDIELWMLVSVDGGSTFLTGASDYGWNSDGGTESTSLIATGDVADAQIKITRGFLPGTVGTGTAESYNGFISVHNANQTTKAICVSGHIGLLDQGSLIGGSGLRGALIANIDEVDAIRFRAETGNLSSGRITLYGLSLS